VCVFAFPMLPLPKFGGERLTFAKPSGSTAAPTDGASRDRRGHGSTPCVIDGEQVVACDNGGVPNDRIRWLNTGVEDRRPPRGFLGLDDLMNFGLSGIRLCVHDINSR